MFFRLHLDTKGAVTSKEHAYRNYPARTGEVLQREERSNNDTTERCRTSAETETAAEFFSRVIWNDNDWMYMYRQAQMRILRFSIIAGAIL